MTVGPRGGETWDEFLARTCSEPVDLTAARLQPIAEVVEILEESLSRAKAGELRSVAIASQSEAAATSTAYALGDGDRAHLVFAMEALKLRLILED